MTIDRRFFPRHHPNHHTLAITCTCALDVRMLLKAAMDLLLAAVALTVDPSRPVAEVLLSPTGPRFLCSCAGHPGCG
jgi:hypothetical protein